MMRHSFVIVTITTIFIATSALTSHADRKEVLQLYQESLFQETGIGDLELAKKLYLSIMVKHKDYRDIIAVVIYRLGMIYEKNGEFVTAEKYYKDIVNKYGDQEKIVKQAEAKLMELEAMVKEKKMTAMNSQHELKITETDKSSGSEQPVQAAYSKLTTTTKPEKETSPMIGKIGIGINTNIESMLGMNARIGIADNLLLEARLLFKGGENTMTGGRAYYLMNRTTNTISLIPYTGMEYSWMASKENGEGYAVGGFVGVECNFSGSFGVGADLGYYYQKIKNDTVLQNNTKLDFNAYITVYF